MVAAAREHPGAVIQGPTRPDPAELGRDRVLSHTVREELYRGLFWNVWHYLLWRSVLALAAPGGCGGSSSPAT